jgi:hypothetical protein
LSTQRLEESTHTGVVGVLAAMIWTPPMLQIGTEVSLTNRFSQQTADLRMARIEGKRDGELCESSVELALP